MSLLPSSFVDPLSSTTFNHHRLSNGLSADNHLYSRPPVSASASTSSSITGLPNFLSRINRTPITTNLIKPSTSINDDNLSKIAVIKPNITTATSNYEKLTGKKFYNDDLSSTSSTTTTTTTTSKYDKINDKSFLLDKESSEPVIFEGSLNFILGVNKQKVNQKFQPVASHLEPDTASSYLSNRISRFLERTDHIMNEWKKLGKNKKTESSNSASSSLLLNNNSNNSRGRSLSRTKSATNILIKGYRYFSRDNSLARNSSSRCGSRISEDRTLSECNEEVFCQ